MPPLWQTCLIAAIPGAVAGLMAVVVVLVTRRGTKADIREIHLSINSRFDEFVKSAKAAAWAGGRAEAQDEERKRN